jgi:hypothetical protein
MTRAYQAILGAIVSFALVCLVAVSCAEPDPEAGACHTITVASQRFIAIREPTIVDANRYIGELRSAQRQATAAGARGLSTDLYDLLADYRSGSVPANRWEAVEAHCA